MKTIKNIKSIENLDDILDKYDFQKQLTDKLDLIDEPFTQHIINEIVLWKVSRYANMTSIDLEQINSINSSEKILNERITREVLGNLLGIKGIGLPMASTILRFKAPNIYQIIDKRVYRYIYGETLNLSSVVTKQIDIYIKYLIDLRKVCQEYNIEFHLSDRKLYQLHI